MMTIIDCSCQNKNKSKGIFYVKLVIFLYKIFSCYNCCDYHANNTVEQLLQLQWFLVLMEK